MLKPVISVKGVRSKIQVTTYTFTTILSMVKGRNRLLECMLEVKTRNRVQSQICRLKTWQLWISRDLDLNVGKLSNLGSIDMVS